MFAYSSSSNHNHTCSLSVVRDATTLLGAESRLEARYPKGRTCTLLADAGLGLCYTPTQAASMAIAGVVCFGVGGLVLLGWAFFELYFAFP